MTVLTVLNTGGQKLDVVFALLHLQPVGSDVPFGLRVFTTIEKKAVINSTFNAALTLGIVDFIMSRAQH